ncbi:hypothetical protein E1176_09770, partial [Fulvivirga sp. RKSG066]|uniref:Ig-like domain-containing protein n=1 Tax=Fulvivirga aurantia TaxID=2529383 RepID=UPI0012BCB654
MVKKGRLLLVFIIIFFGSFQVYSQSCSGADGTPVITGNLVKGNGNLCANSATIPYNWEITYNNVDDGGNPNLVEFVVTWDDGTAQVFSYSPVTGTNVVNKVGPNEYRATITHFFPRNGAEVKCEYTPQVYLQVNGVSCASSTTQTPGTVVKWNTDDQNTGNLELSESNTGLVVFEVCAGEEVDLTFLDRSTFNCVPPGYAGPGSFPNNRKRWFQFVYGTANTITSSTGVLIDGINYTYPYTDPTVTESGAIATGPIPVETGVITIPSDASPGEVFEVTLNNWNWCNSYPGNAPVITTAQVLIIESPSQANNLPEEICHGSGLGGVNFQINGTGGSTVINWYDNDPDIGGNLIANPNGNNSNSFPASSFPGGLDTNIAGTYSMWATYVVGATNGCESEPEEVTVTVRDELDRPDPINSSSSICNNTNNVTFSVPDPEGSTPFGGNWEYQWNSTGGGGVNFDATSGQSVTVDFNIGGTFTSVTRTIRVRRRYINNPRCNSPYRTRTVTIFGQTQGGSTTSDNTICEGDNTGVITLSGHIGTILNWERQVDGGGFIDIGNNGNTTFNENLAAEGTYEYRAVIDNGPCTTETSTITTIEVNPIPVQPTISEVGDGVDICENGDQVILQSSNVDGNADEYAWFKDPDLTTPVQQTSSNQLILNSVAESGRYFVQVIGINPTNCESAISAPIDVVINPLPRAAVSGGGSVCAGIPGPPAVITMTGTGPFNVTYERNGNPTTVNNITSPYTIPGSSTVTDDPDTYVVTSITDLGTTVNCTVTAPSPNITGSATIATSGTPPPTIDSFTVGAPVCDDGPGTVLPSITLDLNPNSAENYDIDFEIRNSATALVLSRTINKNTDGAGVLTFNTTDLDYADLGNLPDTYEIRLTSIINTFTGCNAAGLPELGTITINPRPADPVNPVDGVACSSDLTGATISVDDPGAGNLIVWYEDAALSTIATGTTGGNNQEQFTPTSNATFTYYAVTESQTAPTLCQSVNAVPVQHTQDLAPSPAADFPDFETCDQTATLSATPADNGGTGIWTLGSVVYYEPFPSSDNDLGITGPNPHAFGFTHPNNNWSVAVPGNSIFTATQDWIKVDNGRMSARDVNNSTVEWVSTTIPLTGSVDISLDLAETGNQSGTDFIRAFYRLNGVIETQFGAIDDDATSDGVFETFTASGVGVAGNNLEIIVRAKNNGNTDEHWLDNIKVTPTGTSIPSIIDPNNPNTTVTGLQVGPQTFTWTITSALGVCSSSSDDVTITRNPLPDVIDPNPEVCEVQPRESDDATVDLESYENSITTLPAGNRTVSWFTDPGLTINPADIN